MAQVFRKSSIEKLSNPEQLDKMITVTSPMSWIALLGVLLIIVATLVWSFVGTLPTTQSVNGVVVSPDSANAYYADKAGTVVRVLKKTGDSVKQNDGLVVIKSNDGKEYTIRANAEGKVTDILVEPDSKVYAGAEIARYTSQVSEGQVVVCYVPVSVANQIKKDMKVLIYPSSIDTQKYGYLQGKVEYVGDYTVNTNNMWYVLGANNLVAEQFLEQGPMVSVVCRFTTDSTSKSGYLWSSDKGKDITIANGTFATAKIIVEECAPITKLFSNISDIWEE